MKKGLTELVFILDRSGSMSGLESDTIGGYNSMLEKQRNGQGEAVITTVLFDNDYELLHDRINSKGVKPITAQEYFVRGTTALLDAMGKTINKIGNVMKNTSRDERAEKVLFVIVTDGFENASREFSQQKIKSMVEHQKTKYGWEFIFLVANIDAITEAEKVGISADRAVDFVSDGEGTELNYTEMSETIRKIRCSEDISGSEWKKKIAEDYARRGGNARFRK